MEHARRLGDRSSWQVIRDRGRHYLFFSDYTDKGVVADCPTMKAAIAAERLLNVESKPSRCGTTLNFNGILVKGVDT